MTRPLALRLLAALMLSGCLVGTAAAKTTWASVKELSGTRTVCLEIGGSRLDYALVGAGDAARCELKGPRRLKVTSRYVFAADDTTRVPYTVIVFLDGTEVLRKSFTGTVQTNVDLCDGEGRVGTLRRGYVELPDGNHELVIRTEHAGAGGVAIRLFRQVRLQRDRWIAFSPESYGEIRHLQFENGSQSTYYHFDSVTPLNLTVIGPTTLRVGTRLDFDHLMNGAQTYAVQVAIDDQVWRTYHFDSDRLATAVYLERPDILPGDRKEFTVPIARGRHAVEIRCVRPENCGVTAMIHIPKSDLER